MKNPSTLSLLALQLTDAFRQVFRLSGAWVQPATLRDIDAALQGKTMALQFRNENAAENEDFEGICAVFSAAAERVNETAGSVCIDYDDKSPTFFTTDLKHFLAMTEQVADTYSLPWRRTGSPVEEVTEEEKALIRDILENTKEEEAFILRALPPGTPYADRNALYQAVKWALEDGTAPLYTLDDLHENLNAESPPATRGTTPPPVLRFH